MNEKLIKQEKELSAARDTFASTLFNEGARLEKERVLNALPEEFARLHRSGAFHIHDLESPKDPPQIITLQTLQSKSTALPF